MMFEALLKVLGTGLELWVSKEKTKYIDAKMALESSYHGEINKPIAPSEDALKLNPSKYRNNATLDGLEFQLCNLSLAFSTAASRKDA